MAANNATTQLKRRIFVQGSVTRFDLPKLPLIPDSIVARFPEFRTFNEELMRYGENLNQALISALATKKES